MKLVRNRGFTLMELLVVVIIIGILAALATPTFMKAVERTKGGEAFVNLGAIMDAERRYLIDHPYPTQNLDELDIENPNDNPKGYWENYGVGGGSPDRFAAVATRNSGPYGGTTVVLSYTKEDGLVWMGTWPFVPGN